MTVLLFVASFLLAIGLAWTLYALSRQKSEVRGIREHLVQANAEVQRLQGQVHGMTAELHRVNTELQSLRPFAAVRDAHSEAQRINTNAQTAAQSTIAQAQVEAGRIQSEANAAAHAVAMQTSAARETAEAQVRTAVVQAEQIIADARQRAEDVAGDAYKAMEKHAQLNKAVKALQRKIEGYGDAWLVPHGELLDDLAEDYSHKQAGVSLKEARLATKRLVTSDGATECDYVEPHRKRTAKRFVLDAFNGKVDSIFAKLRHDNFGKLEIKIRDAFELVNQLGSAFRSARITAQYCDARITELRWGVIARELQLQERNEQRQIKQALKEEAKAQRDYQKALKELEKEEKVLRRAKLEAERNLKKATAAQRIQFENQLLELEERLREAETKGQRALSMAQQTRRGHVYIISNVGSFGEHIYKIGLTRRLEPLDRVKELGDASVPFPFDVHALIHDEDAPKLEAALHRHFVRHQVNRVNPRKEFFSVGITELRAAVEELGIDVHWTMVAEAAQYRESRAIVQREGSPGVVKTPVAASRVVAP